MAEQTPTTIPTDVREVFERAKLFGDVQVIDIGGGDPDEDPTLVQVVQALSVPSGRTIQSIHPLLDPYRVRPERKKGTSEMATIESFIAQVNRSKDDDSVIFADVANRGDSKLIAVLDYNKAGPEGLPRFGQHRVSYRFPMSDQWKAWTLGNLSNMDQRTFAEFIEARIMDVADPSTLNLENKGTFADFCRQLSIVPASPQRMMELSRGLEVNADQKVMQHINVGSGEQAIAFEEVHKDQAGAPIKIPGGFAILIPVLVNGPAYLMPVRLRYRVAGGSVKWTLQPQRITEVWDDCVKDVVGSVSTKTGLSTLFGTPEK